LLRLDYGESLYSFRSSEKLHASTAITPPPGLIDAVRRGDFIDDRCEFRCSLEEARALRDWLLARAEIDAIDQCRHRRSARATGGRCRRGDRLDLM
jgi:hypothetical protein